MKLVPQGGKASYCGGATPDASGRQIIVSLKRMDRIREVDPVSMSISVDAGVILKNVQDAAAALRRSGSSWGGNALEGLAKSRSGRDLFDR